MRLPPKGCFAGSYFLTQDSKSAPRPAIRQIKWNFIGDISGLAVYGLIIMIITTYAVTKKKINNSTELTMLIWM